MVPDHQPDVVHNLADFPWPFEDNAFDRVEAYELIEHMGQQGDFVGFFRDFTELYRIIKPGGYLCGTSPGQGRWTWGDPGHTRCFSSEHVVFLNQTEYTKQVGVTSMSDYRPWWKGDFEPVGGSDNSAGFRFILRAVKPARLTVSRA